MRPPSSPPSPPCSPGPRRAGAPVIHIRNNGGPEDPDAPGSDGWQLVSEVLPGEPVVDKREPDGFAGTDLEARLAGARRIVVAGMQSEWCVRETSLAARERGLEVVLVRGAHATYDSGARTAGEISAEVDAELSAAGAEVRELDDVRF